MHAAPRGQRLEAAEQAAHRGAGGEADALLEESELALDAEGLRRAHALLVAAYATHPSGSVRRRHGSTELRRSRQEQEPELPTSRLEPELPRSRSCLL